MRTSFLRSGLVLLAIAAFFAVALPSEAQRPDRSRLRFHFGQFEPDGESQYWDGNRLAFTGEPSDFEDTVFGVDYVRGLNQRFSWIVSLTDYEGQQDRADLFFVDVFGNDIVHQTTLGITSLTGGLLYHLLGRGRAFDVYVGAGGGAYSWDLEERGRFVDNDAFTPEIFNARFEDDGVAFGWFWLAGVDVLLTRRFGVFGELREHSVEDDLSGDFEGLGELDLSGRSLSGGVSIRF